MRRKSLSGAVAALCAGAAVAAAGAPAASADTQALAGTAVPNAVHAQVTGAVSAATPIKFELVLKLRDEAGAQALVQAVSTPGSPSFRHYVTAAQWESEFSPTDAQVALARLWLAAKGFAVGAVSKDRITIAAAGTAAQVESAFGTTLENYKVAGRTMRLADSSLTIPSAVSGVVAGALGINQYVATPADAGNPDIPGSSTTSAPAATGSGVFPPAPNAFITHAPCSLSYGAKTTTVSPSFGNGFPDTVPDVVCGYRPGQLRSAYGLTSANTGAGATVAVVDAYGSATIASDATRYFAATAPTEPFASADFTQIDQTPFQNESECSAPGWATEQAIDVEAVHSMAPDAHILYVGAQDCINGLFTADQTVIDDGLADVVTNSWGDIAGDLLDDSATRAAYDAIFMLADSTGITVQFSSGDDGDDFNLVGASSAEYPASSPFVTAVGGTTLEIGANGQRLGELGWDTGRSFLCTANLAGDLSGCTSSTVGTWLPASPDGISGGYTSYDYTQPFYQAGVVPDSLSERNAAIFGPVPLRVVPDISAEADAGTGFLIGLHQTLPDGLSLYTETRYGGTSLASPLLAGIVADADQASGTPVGFINPALYKMDTEAPGSIMDIVPTTDNEGNFREDFAGPLALGINNGTTYATGVAESYRELAYSGLETYCDGAGDCASRPEPLTTAPGYDSLTGLGSPGTNFAGILGEY